MELGGELGRSGGNWRELGGGLGGNRRELLPPSPPPHRSKAFSPSCLIFCVLEFSFFDKQSSFKRNENQ